ncbi:MAG: carboxypeptidase-like regulatory domain-containing protein [bacterium]
MTTPRRRKAIPLLIAAAMLSKSALGPTTSHANPTSPGLAGLVLADGGAPVAGSPVGLIDSATGALSAKTETRSSGEFRFDSVRPGRYRLAIGTAGGSFTSAAFVATLPDRSGGDVRVDWTLYPASTRPPEPRTLVAQASRSVAGVVDHPEATTALAQPGFVAEVPVWVLAAGATGGAAGITLGSLCLSGNVLCEEDKAVASPQQ